MDKTAEHVKLWRKRTKERIIKAFGGGCGVCGYNKCNEALELHHIDPKTKELKLSSLKANINNWDLIVKELRKCALLCSNCHKEIHSSIITLPKNVQKFNEYYADYEAHKLWKKIDMDKCPMCEKLKPKHTITCSSKCAGKKTWKFDWDSINIIDMKDKGMSNASIGDIVGVSEASVRVRIRKLKHKLWEKDDLDKCPICGKLKPKRMPTCSKECTGKRAWKVDWDSIDLIGMKNKGMSNTAIGDIVGVSETAVRNHLKKIKI